MGLGSAGRGERAAQRGGHSWSSATSQRRRRDHRGELVEQVAVDLEVAWRCARSVPSSSERHVYKGRVGREVAAVEEVPGDRAELHRPSLVRAGAYHLPLPVARSTSSPARSSRATSSDALLDRALELKARRAERRGRRCAGRQERRADLREAVDPHPGLVRGRGRRARRHAAGPARRRAPALPRRVGGRHRPGPVALRARRS